MRISAALFDNSAFAGLMRVYRPAMDTHRSFWERFPEHRQVDLVATAQFLTAMCLYDSVRVEGSSAGHADSQADIIPTIEHHIRRDFCDSWVRQLANELPIGVEALIDVGVSYGEPKQIIELDERSRQLAFALFTSPLGEQLRLRGEEKLPDVYTSETYVNRKYFERLNATAPAPLSKEMLAQAMFLHRGLFLQAWSSKHLTYVPYLYRGRMLASVPPTLAKQLAHPEGQGPGLFEDSLPDEAAAMRLISQFYFTLLGKLTWTSYDVAVPFIGAAILAKARGDVDAAFRIALDLRADGNLRDLFEQLEQERLSGDRVLYEVMLEEIKEQLLGAARQLGLNEMNPLFKPLFKLVTFWLPAGVDKILETAVSVVPSEVKRFANRVADRILNTKAHQMLLIDHVAALRALRIDARV